MLACSRSATSEDCAGGLSPVALLFPGDLRSARTQASGNGNSPAGRPGWPRLSPLLYSCSERAAVQLFVSCVPDRFKIDKLGVLHARGTQEEVGVVEVGG